MAGMAIICRRRWVSDPEMPCSMASRTLGSNTSEFPSGGLARIELQPPNQSSLAERERQRRRTEGEQEATPPPHTHTYKQPQLSSLPSARPTQLPADTSPSCTYHFHLPTNPSPPLPLRHFIAFFLSHPFSLPPTPNTITRQGARSLIRSRRIPIATAESHPQLQPHHNTRGITVTAGRTNDRKKGKACANREKKYIVTDIPSTSNAFPSRHGLGSGGRATGGGKVGIVRNCCTPAHSRFERLLEVSRRHLQRRGGGGGGN